MKKVRLISSLVMVVALLASSVMLASAQDTTLTIWYLSQSPEEIALVEKLAGEFADMHPGVKIDFSAYSYEDMNQTLALALDSGTGPDVAYGSPGPQDTDLYVKAGHLVDLTDIAVERGWTERLPEDVIRHYNADDSIYVIPYDLVTVGVFYNKDLFNELGLEPPQTFDEFEQILAQIKDEGFIPISVGALDQWPLSHVWEQLLHVSVPYDTITALEHLSPDARFDTPEHLLAAQKLREWADKGYFEDSLLATSYTDANALFINEVAAMNIGGTWNNATFATQAEFEVGFFAMPLLNPAIEPHMGGFTPNNVWMVPIYSPHQDLALDFIDFMLGEQAATEKWEAGDIVAYKFDELPPPSYPLQEDVYNAMQNAGTGYYIGQFSGEFQAASAAGLQELVDGSISPEEFVAICESAYEDALAQ